MYTNLTTDSMADKVYRAVFRFAQDTFFATCLWFSIDKVTLKGLIKEAALCS